MINKLISKIILDKLFLSMLFFIFISANSFSQSNVNAVELNRNINSQYNTAAGIHSYYLVGYPPNSDVWIMHVKDENRAVAVTDKYIINRTGNYAELPGEKESPYSIYLNMHDRWYDSSADGAVAEKTVTPYFVTYKNYVRPSDREDEYVNYLEPAPVVTVKTNTIVPPHGINYYKPVYGNKNEPVRDFRTDIWQYKDYTEKNIAPVYDVYISALYNETVQ